MFLWLIKNIEDPNFFAEVSCDNFQEDFENLSSKKKQNPAQLISNPKLIYLEYQYILGLQRELTFQIIG